MFLANLVNLVAILMQLGERNIPYLVPRNLGVSINPHQIPEADNLTIFTSSCLWDNSSLIVDVLTL
jgi:hypothetical protein